MRTQRKAVLNGIASRMAPCMLPNYKSPKRYPLFFKCRCQLDLVHITVLMEREIHQNDTSPYLHYFPASSIFMCQILYDSTFHALLWYSSWQSTLVKKILPLFVLERYLLLGLSRESMFPAISADLQLFEASSSLCSWFCWLCTTFLWWPVVTWYCIMVAVKAVGSGNSKCWHVPWKKFNVLQVEHNN